MRAMALDVGDVRIGISLSDPLMITAQGLKTLERIGIKKDTTAIADIIKENDVNIVVIGLPLGLGGNDTSQTQKVREFKEKLENKIKSLGMKDITFAFSDERFSSVIAENILIDADVSRKDRRLYVDKMAASVILQGYLDTRKNSQ